MKKQEIAESTAPGLAAQLRQRIADRTATVGVIGLGYVGLPLILTFSEAGFPTVGFDVDVLGAVGLLSERPVPVFDPDHRSFDFRVRGAFTLAVGFRFFACRWFAAGTELRDFVFVDRTQSSTISSPPTDPTTWYAPSTLDNNVELLLTVSIFLPLPQAR